MTFVTLLYYALPCLLVTHLWLRRTRRARYPFPPGPKPRPLVGNILDLPFDSPAEKYREWAREFSEYHHLCLFMFKMLKEFMLYLYV